MKGESPLSKGEWASGKKIHPSRRVNHPKIGRISLLKGESPRSLNYKRVNNLFNICVHPLEGWLTLQSPFFNSDFLAIHPSEGWIFFPKAHLPFEKVDSPFKDSSIQKWWMEGWIGWITLRRLNESSHVIHFSQQFYAITEEYCLRGVTVLLFKISLLPVPRLSSSVMEGHLNLNKFR